MAFFGELYLRTTLPFLPPGVTEREVAYLARAFEGLPVAGPLVDLGCGHGRHAAPLVAHWKGERTLVGLENDPATLAQRLPGFPVVRGDLRALPFGTGQLAGGYSWYSTLFVFEHDAVHRAVLQEARRCFRPGARFVLHTVPYERLAASPGAQFERTLPDKSRIAEQSQFDPRTGLDTGRRTLTLPDGRVLSGEYRIRYYPAPELCTLFEAAGFKVRWLHGDLDGGPLERQSLELILGVEVPHA